MADADDRPKSPDVKPDGSLKESPVDPINPETEPSGRYWPVITRYRVIKFVAIVALFGTVAAFALGVVSVSDVSDGLKSIGDDGPIQNVTVTDNNVAVSFPEEHNADRVAIRHEYDQSYDNRIVLAGPEVQDAPRFGGTVTFSSTGDELGQSFFCTSQYPTHDFVVAAIDQQAVDGGGVKWEVLDRQTIEVPLRQIGC